MATQKKKTNAKAAKKKSSGGGWSISFALFWLMVSGALFLPTTIVFVVGMIPVVIAYLMEFGREKTAAYTMAPMNIAGIFPALMQLWQGSHTVDGAIRALTTAENILFIIGGSVGGGIIYYAVPMTVAAVAVARGEGRLRALKRKMGNLLDEWGDEVAAGSEHLLPTATRNNSTKSNAPRTAPSPRS